MGFTEELHKLPVIIMVVLFGTGSWVAINGLWVELPLFVALGIPEGYNLASYLVIIIQIANIGPLIFTIASYFAKGKRLEVQAICIILPMGILACLLLVFFWDVTMIVKGVERSTPLLILAFFVSIVDCTSSVAFTPFMARFKSSYLTWYFIGEGFSALLPSLVALGQGVGNEVCVANYTYLNETTGQNCTAWTKQMDPPNFPPEDFFWFLFTMMLTSFIAFILLNKLPIARKEYNIEELASSESSNSSKSISSGESLSLANKYETKGDEIDVDLVATLPEANANDPMLPKTSRSILTYVYLYMVLGIVCALSNGVLPSIQSYSCGAYGYNAYLLAATLGNVANPVGAFIVMLFPQSSLILVGVTAFCGSLVGGYCLATAALSPTPPLQDEMAGTVLVVSHLKPALLQHDSFAIQSDATNFSLLGLCSLPIDFIKRTIYPIIHVQFMLNLILRTHK